MRDDADMSLIQDEEVTRAARETTDEGDAANGNVSKQLRAMERLEPKPTHYSARDNPLRGSLGEGTNEDKVASPSEALESAREGEDSKMVDSKKDEGEHAEEEMAHSGSDGTKEGEDVTRLTVDKPENFLPEEESRRATVRDPKARPASVGPAVVRYSQSPLAQRSKGDIGRDGSNNGGKYKRT